MKCLIKYKWVKLPRDIDIDAKGLMTCYTRLATRAAFSKGMARYCGFENPVVPGMWSGGIVGVKSILGIKSRCKAYKILDTLQELGYLIYTLDRQPDLRRTLWRKERKLISAMHWTGRFVKHDALWRT